MFMIDISAAVYRYALEVLYMRPEKDTFRDLCVKVFQRSTKMVAKISQSVQFI